MADKKISDLTAGSAISGTEELPIVQSGSTVKTTISAIKTYFDAIYKATFTENTAFNKNFGTGTINVPEIGATLGNSETVETNASGKLITAAKGTAYNKDFGTTAGTVLEGNANVSAPIIQDFTISSALTGTLSTTLIKSGLIAANTIEVGDEVEIRGRALRNTVTGSATHFFYYNTSSSLSGATLIGTQSQAAGYFGMTRNLYVRATNSTETVFASASSSNSDATTSSALGTAVSSLNIDWTNDVYIIQAFQNAAVGDSTTSRGLIVIRNRF